MNPTKCRSWVPVAALWAVLCFSVARAAPAPFNEKDFGRPIRIACVGDSVTQGFGLRNPARESYPAQLGARLGERWQVRNFGLGGRTLLKEGDCPYSKEGAFRDAQAFAPDGVIIALGTNDTKPQNWARKENFVTNYIEMVRVFQGLPCKPRIWICYPVPAFAGGWGINGKTVKEEICPMVDQVAAATGAVVIDLHSALPDRTTMIGDGIHPNPRGAGLIATTVFAALTGRPADAAPATEAPAAAKR